MDSSGEDSGSEDGGGRGLGAFVDSDSSGGHVGLGSGPRKRRRGGGDDDGVLGVFAAGEDDDAPQRKKKGKGKGRRKGGGGIKDLAPVAFVAGPAMKPTEKPLKPQAAAGARAGSEDEDVDPRFRFDAPSVSVLPGVEQGPKLPARNKMSFEQMNRNYGKGFSMLQKMGFTGGGLGKREDGIANPIEVALRKNGQALQDEGEVVEQDLYGTEWGGSSKKSVEELLSSKPGKSNEPKPSESWKKSEREKRPKVIYKTAAEAAGPAPAMRIIDMRGPQVKIAGSFDELKANLGMDEVRSLKELRHNARLLVVKYEDKLRSIAEKKRYYEDLLIATAKESDQLQASDSLTDREVRRCRDLVGTIEDLRERQDRGTISLAELATTFRNLRIERPKEFRALRGFDVAVSLAVPAARRELALWNPLKEPSKVGELLAPWKDVADDKDTTALETLCDAALLPRLRSALSTWDVRDAEPCVCLFEACREALPPAVANAAAAQVVLPRLKSEVDGWDPRRDAMPLHLWVHPWLPVLGARLACLWAPIRFKLSACLEAWTPDDPSALAVISPWHPPVFDPANWEPLVEKVFGKLARAISETPVRPSGQDLGPVKALLAWREVLPIEGIARVLEDALFPQWLEALRTWLRVPGCDFGEVVQWYQGWRALMPEEVREQSGVQRHLAHGLQVMKSMMEAAGTGKEAPSSPSPDRPAARAAPAAPEPSVSVGAAEDVNLTLSDYLADEASSNGIIFRPKPQVKHLGKQVYQFGSASIYLERSLVFVAPKGEANVEWKAVSFEELLRIAKKAPAKSKS